MDNKQHKTPHIHVRYGDDECVFDIPNGNVLSGTLPLNKTRLIQAWVEIHKEDLMANWQLAVAGQHPVRIEPLR